MLKSFYRTEKLVFAISVLLFAGGSPLGADDVQIIQDLVETESTFLRARTIAVRRGVSWLLNQQATDGGWHSMTYGNMKGGVGNTALALSALSLLPKTFNDEIDGPFFRGVRFLTERQDQSGFVAGHEDAADYPVYSTALLLTACMRRPSDKLPVSREQLCESLLLAQHRVANGWEEDHPDFGGWNVLGDRLKGLDQAHRANISVTMHVLDALQAAKALTPIIRRDALIFLSRCQNLGTEGRDEGGFFFTPRWDDPLNKAGSFQTNRGAYRVHSYCTATCDGLVALLACEIPKTDTRWRAATEWLSSSAPSAVSSIEDVTSQHSILRGGLDFYEAAAIARIANEFRDARMIDRSSRLIEIVLERQAQNGSWSNLDPRMREDDPMIATAFALNALINSLATEPAN